MPATEFSQKIYSLAARIPKGNVATYGQLAQLAGNAKAARAVGRCMRENTDRVRVPCHRVVAANGALTGYVFDGGVVSKKEMLLAEGVVFKGEYVDISVSLWHP